MKHIPENFESKFGQLAEEIICASRAVGLAAALVDKHGNFLYEGYFGFRDEEKKVPIDRDTIFGQIGRASCRERV